MFNEIGSEFWLESIPDESNYSAPDWITRFGETVLTASGRGAISLLLQQITPKYRTVLLPAYICESVILPFEEQGYTCYFYEIDRNFNANIDRIILNRNIGVFLHLGYYGFPTNVNLTNVVQSFKDQSIIIIEDVTHTLFSNIKRFEENDYYIASLRKWFGIPSGGLLASSKRQVKWKLFNNDEFTKIRIEALFNKGRYVNTEDNKLKRIYLTQFADAEAILDSDVTPYSMDNLSKQLINIVDVDNLARKRRENFIALSVGFKEIDYLETSFSHLPKGVSPFFYPVFIKGDRDKLRKKLIEERIYCPVHWPIPKKIRKLELESALGVYNYVLSIPCDQRYGVHDMERIISVLADF